MALKEKKATNPHQVSWRDDGGYSARNSSKGALLEESARIFRLISTGESHDAVREQVFRGPILTQRSFHNRKRIWTTISHRYLLKNEQWLELLLSQKCELGARSAEFSSLLYVLYSLYTKHWRVISSDCRSIETTPPTFSRDCRPSRTRGIRRTC